MSERVQLWSSGGGVQSTAIAVLILQGKLPRPDIAVIADTEREKSSTWRYMDEFTGPALEKIGVNLIRAKKSHWNAPDLYDRKGEKPLMPLWSDASGTLGKLQTWCSTEWKRDVVRRVARAHFPDSQYRQWMGISYDEPRRIKPMIGKWEMWYPLYEMRIRRNDCLNLVRDYGWPEPPKSACWMCPNHRAEDWVRLSRENPGELLKAVILEEELRERDDTLYLHEFGEPLATAVMRPLPENGKLFDTERCNSGYCFV